MNDHGNQDDFLTSQKLRRTEKALEAELDHKVTHIMLDRKVFMKYFQQEKVRLERQLSKILARRDLPKMSRGDTYDVDKCEKPTGKLCCVAKIKRKMKPAKPQVHVSAFSKLVRHPSLIGKDDVNDALDSMTDTSLTAPTCPIITIDDTSEVNFNNTIRPRIRSHSAVSSSKRPVHCTSSKDDSTAWHSYTPLQTNTTITRRMNDLSSSCDELFKPASSLITQQLPRSVSEDLQIATMRVQHVANVSKSIHGHNSNTTSDQCEDLITTTSNLDSDFKDGNGVFTLEHATYHNGNHIQNSSLVHGENLTGTSTNQNFCVAVTSCSPQKDLIDQVDNAKGNTPVLITQGFAAKYGERENGDIQADALLHMPQPPRTPSPSRSRRKRFSCHETALEMLE